MKKLLFVKAFNKKSIGKRQLLSSDSESENDRLTGILDQYLPFKV